MATVGLRVIDDDGFVLAGGFALRADGFGDRPSDDIDLFTNVMDSDRFDAAVGKLVGAYRADGLTADVVRRAPSFARISVADEQGTSKVDLGVDYRQLPPARTELGPVLSAQDAVANKVNALYSRLEPRDLMDIQAVLDSGRYTPDEMLTLADEREAVPLDRQMLASQMRAGSRLPDAGFAMYGAAPGLIERVRQTLAASSVRLSSPSAEQDVAQPSAILDE